MGVLSLTNEDEYKDIIKDMSNILYLKSFSEDRNNLLMWSKYADNYSGMCVEYDLSKLNNDILFHLYPVVYSNKRRELHDLKYAIEEHLEMLSSIRNQNSFDFEHLKEIIPAFLQKSKCWEYEKEWRVIASRLNLDCYSHNVDVDGDETRWYNLNSQEIDFDCVSKIFVGPKIEKVKLEHIIKIGKDIGVDVVEMKMSNTEYKLEEKCL